jgi:hypothetical protein
MGRAGVRGLNFSLPHGATSMTRIRMSFSDTNWVCFFVLFEAKTDVSCYICMINLIIAIGFVL